MAASTTKPSTRNDAKPLRVAGRGSPVGWLPTALPCLVPGIAGDFGPRFHGTRFAGVPGAEAVPVADVRTPFAVITGPAYPHGVPGSMIT